ncbi:hypothetical protein BN12_60034 [Nostocoides japonicum T1-X7]|uniref:Uncharacterized protein n=1 Tax=Nostocoides japonicum T1-X7 TaxID=1194083 RepID=A0A077M0K7_9MICO|nr:hypothetical protein BN12_60034 [Tetrasphaera japonica T1-X7]
MLAPHPFTMIGIHLLRYWAYRACFALVCSSASHGTGFVPDIEVHLPRTGHQTPPTNGVVSLTSHEYEACCVSFAQLTLRTWQGLTRYRACCRSGLSDTCSRYGERSSGLDATGTGGGHGDWYRNRVDPSHLEPGNRL